MRYKTLQDEKLLTIMLQREQIVNMGKELENKVTELQKPIDALREEQDKLLLKFNRLQEKGNTILEKLIDPKELGEFEEFGNLKIVENENGKELQWQIIDVVERFKEEYLKSLEDKKKKDGPIEHSSVEKVAEGIVGTDDQKSVQDGSN